MDIKLGNMYTTDYIEISGFVVDLEVTFESETHTIVLVEVNDDGCHRYVMVTYEFDACISREVDAFELSEDGYYELKNSWSRVV